MMKSTQSQHKVWQNQAQLLRRAAILISSGYEVCHTEYHSLRSRNKSSARTPLHADPSFGHTGTSPLLLHAVLINETTVIYRKILSCQDICYTSRNHFCFLLYGDKSKNSSSICPVDRSSRCKMEIISSCRGCPSVNLYNASTFISLSYLLLS